MIGDDLTQTTLLLLLGLLLCIVWIAMGVLGIGMLFAFFARSEQVKNKSYELWSLQYYGPLLIFFGAWTLYVAIVLASDGWLWPWSARACREAGIEHP